MVLRVCHRRACSWTPLGVCQINWNNWRVSIEQSRRLTIEGRKLASAAVTLLERLLPDLTPRVFETTLPWWPGNDVPQVYVRLFELFVHLTLPKDSGGYSRFRRLLQENVEPAYWHHACVVLELSGLALRAGWSVEFEPSIGNDHQADLRLKSGDETIVIESLSMGMDTEMQEVEGFFRKVGFALFAIDTKYSVYCTGALESVLDEAALARWLDQVNEAAAAVAAGEPTRRVLHPIGGEIVVYKSSPGPGSTKLRGPRISGNEWGRIEQRIARKARQTATARNVWLRIDELGGLWHFTPWSTGALSDKLSVLLPYVQSAIQPYGHLSGVLISNAWDYRGPTTSDERCEVTSTGIGLRRGLPVSIYRETMLIGRDATVGTSLQTLAAWYDEEPTWLDWALQSMGRLPLSELLILT